MWFSVGRNGIGDRNLTGKTEGQGKEREVVLGSGGLVAVVEFRERTGESGRGAGEKVN